MSPENTRSCTEKAEGESPQEPPVHAVKAANFEVSSVRSPFQPCLFPYGSESHVHAYITTYIHTWHPTKLEQTPNQDLGAYRSQHAKSTWGGEGRGRGRETGYVHRYVHARNVSTYKQGLSSGKAFAGWVGRPFARPAGRRASRDRGCRGMGEAVWTSAN